MNRTISTKKIQDISILLWNYNYVADTEGRNTAYVQIAFRNKTKMDYVHSMAGGFGLLLDWRYQ